MQQLHLVGFTTDLEGLIFSARKGAKSGGYLVVLDDKLRATVEDAFRLRNGQAPAGDGADEEGSAGGAARPRRPRPESTLSPREIQARLRSGSTIAEVAEEAGVDEEWVSRFAVPIQAEQAQVVGRARRLTFVKPRLGESALPLGTAVRWNLADKGIRLFDDDYEAAWSAYNLQGASWVVRFEYASRQKRQVAEWEVDLREGELFARNRTASELGYLDGARRRRRPPPLEPSPRETPARPVESARPAPAVATRPARREDAAEPPVPSRPPARPPARTGTAAGRSGAPTSGRSAVKKAAGAAKGRTTTAAKKAGKATTSRKAASGKKARPQKPAGKKRGSADHAVAPAPTKATAAPPPPPDEPARPSHLARPPSPMPTARRATTLPLHTPRPVAPRPVVSDRPRRPPPPPEPEPEFDEVAPMEEAAPVAAAPKPAPKPVAPRTEEPPRRVVTEGVRVLPPPGRANGQGSTDGPRRRPTRPATPEAEPIAAARRPSDTGVGDTPERKLARRLASSPAGGEGGRGRTRSRPVPAADRPVAPAQPEGEPLWHGPGSGEPAPTVRIRADLAAGTRRPGEGADDPVADAGPATPAAARTRRRERPLRAR